MNDFNNILTPNDYETAIAHSDIYVLHFNVKNKVMTVPRKVSDTFMINQVMENIPESLIESGLILDNIEGFREFFNEIQSGTKISRFRVELKSRVGVGIWIEGTGTTVLDKDGKPDYTVISVFNISNQRKRSYYYQKWEPTIRATIAECMHYYDFNLTTDMVEMTGGYSPSVLPLDISLKFDDSAKFVAENIIHPDDCDEYLKDFNIPALINNYNKNEVEFHNHHRRRGNDGTYFWAERIVQLFPDPYNNNIHCMIMIRKVADTLAKVKEELKAGAHELASASVPGGIIGMYNKPNYPVYYINEHMLTFLGYNEYDDFMKATGAEAANIIHPDDVHRTSRSIIQALRKNESFELQIRIIKKDESVAWVIIRGKKNKEANGKNLIICHFTDITPIISLQEELQDAAAAAAEASNMKSAFLANMSHEIRTPMNGIIGFIELALDEPGLSQGTIDHLEKIRTSADGLLAIINDILDISKIEAGKMEIEKVPFKLHDVLSHCENLFRIKAEEKGIKLSFKSEPAIDQKINGDPNKLAQILINLLSNAVKFTDQGFVKLEATLIASYDNKLEICFTVKDSGIGMSRSQIKTTLAPFTQADQSATRKYGGTGLGLTITHNLVNLMGGTLLVESELGVGSSFSFTLLYEGTVERVIAHKAPVMISKPHFEGEILVCEDNVINQQVIVEHLERIGLNAIIAENGQIAIDIVNEKMMAGQFFDLILMDIHMPVMDGIEATHKLLSLGITTPIVALTANAMKRDRESYLSLGMSDYISKPFYAQELWTCLLKYLTPLSLEENDVKLPDTGKHAQQELAVDESIGLEHAVNDAELYEHLKRNFYLENSSRYEEIAESLISDDLTNARRIIHSLKSNANWIGAIKLSLIAAEIEENYIADRLCTNEQLLLLQDELNRVLKELAPLADKKSIQQNIEKTTLILLPRELVDKLEPLLDSGNAEVGRYLGEIADVFADFSPYCEELIQQIGDYDFEEAYVTLEKIKERVELG
ncbi:MAG: ATP-binding protein [Lachnospiraceae bacterium]|nr:ATP-binding protein [Lachnospiraceae bacterium]